ncbi:RNA polymerase II C-terminal domain kinase beta subunit [Emydomyces testavorans]|uniref:RNA polymerase II C-terminal domain kinase beta subunit n=1 Tax=Emydomyces testavorans TaxID=2070801 RepID=A0AAF0DMW6_9EURO|nr:RNA polymerase II C-terminal domain kinase beta subunit [Emydomyces testavorans]
MTPARSENARSSEQNHARPPPPPPPVGPHPSFIQVANPYVFEKTVQECFAATGVNPQREDSIRLQGITWIDNDAAGAALFTACKIEDTLKKSRDILCTAYNLKLSRGEQLSADDPIFESHSRSIIGLERLMLESSGFDFRNRHPQKILLKLIKRYGLKKDSKTARVAYTISLDLYRTFAPLKQTSTTMAFACLELAGRLLDDRLEEIESESEYQLWQTSRAEVMETILDVLELYTHHRNSTSVGPDFSIDTLLNIRIPLNQEADSKKLPRYAYFNKRKPDTNGVRAPNGSKRDREKNNRNVAGPAAKETPPINPLAPTAAHDPAQRANERGRETTIRFMLNPEQAKAERSTVEQYFKVEMEEYEVEE